MLKSTEEAPLPNLKMPSCKMGKVIKIQVLRHRDGKKKCCVSNHASQASNIRKRQRERMEKKGKVVKGRRKGCLGMFYSES